MSPEEFLSLLKARPALSDTQRANLARIREIAETFHRAAGTHSEVQALLTTALPEEETIVLESGHQPNFWPYAGVWKKVFLLDFFAQHLAASGRDCIPLFGFADHNLSTAKWLYQNRIPSNSRDGFETIGFSISGKDRWKRFACTEKPKDETWLKELERIRTFYHDRVHARDDAMAQLDQVFDEMARSYALSTNFADLNAFLVSRICNRLLSLQVLFFRYSDVQRAGIFMDESVRLLTERERFNQRYTEIIQEEGLEDISTVSEESVPFWYHCGCGGKVPLSGSHTRPPANERYAGTCPVCREQYELPFAELADRYDRMSPNAVARNLVFSEGLGTALFVSGAGGGLRYGLISDKLAREFRFTVPLTVAWLGRDYYVGPAHRTVLKDLQRSSGLAQDTFYGDAQPLLTQLAATKAELAVKINHLEQSGGGTVVKKDLQKYQGRSLSLDTQLKTASRCFAVTPSFLDLLVSVGLEALLAHWKRALIDAELTNQAFYLIPRAVIHGDARLFNLYQNLNVLGEQAQAGECG
ncbi:MAG TPA: hypothetical protein ENN68_06825 [Methanomicrobia archaeon]|nr:hypothetical protein [Methanomicrobia archaeon]